MLLSKEIEKELFFKVVEENPEGFNNRYSWKQIIRINENGERTLLSTATDKYQLIKNEDLYKPLFIVIETCGGKIVKYQNEMRGTRNWVTFEFPNKVIQINGVSFQPQVTLKNSYDSSLKCGASIDIVSGKNILRQYTIGGTIKHQGKSLIGIKELGDNITNSLIGFEDTVKPFLQKLFNFNIKINDVGAVIATLCSNSLSLSKRRITAIEESISLKIKDTDKLSLFDIYLIISNNINTLPSKQTADTAAHVLSNAVERMTNK